MDDAGFFAEMLALLDDGPEHQLHALSLVAPTPASQRLNPHISLPVPPAEPQKPARGIGSAARRKFAIDALRIEHQRMSDQLDLLRGCAYSQTIAPFPLARERAMAERIKRCRAEQECAALRRALFQQMQFLRGVRGAVAAGCGASLAYMHTFTRLPRDRVTRQSEYTALTRAERLDAAIELLCHETGAISFVDAHLQTDNMREADESCAASDVSATSLAFSHAAQIARTTSAGDSDGLSLLS